MIQHGWLESAQQLKSPNFSERPGHVTINMVVIHCISLPEGIFGNRNPRKLFLNQLDEGFGSLCQMRVSTHLLIERTGEVFQFVNFNDCAWHAGESRFRGESGCNAFSIGIELEGANTQPYTNEQYEQLNYVLPELMIAYPAITADRVIGHCHVAPGRKTDPGLAFDWTRLGGEQVQER